MTYAGRRLAVAIAFAASTLTATLAPATQASAGLFTQPKYAAIVVDANTGEVLYNVRADAERHPASLTKIMTLYLTFEALATGRLSLDETITISPHAYSMMPSKVSTHAGETLTVAEAIPAMTVHSANDVAVAIAERIGGSEPRFAQLMTLRAHELGMTETSFVNASGLPPDGQQISSARDMALLSRAVMRDYPQYYHYFGLKSITFRGKVLQNHNHLVARMPGVDGMKTGYTSLAGFNLVASAMRDNHRLIAVVLGGPSTAARDENVEEL
ncbi:MAG: D-alanyl-D-alanine carboxypeptidase family protein, partial [Caulobacteraceae bacterium]